jgi:hypothetical protein
MGALLILIALSTATAAQTKKFHSSSSGTSKSSGAYHPTKSADEKKMPRSTAPARVNSKSQAARQNELSRIEHQNARHQQAQSKHKTPAQSERVQPVHAKSEGHGSEIRFAHHEPRGSGTKATTGNGRKRH